MVNFQVNGLCTLRLRSVSIDSLSTVDPALRNQRRYWHSAPCNIESVATATEGLTKRNPEAVQTLR
jgi:hypothetical protein